MKYGIIKHDSMPWARRKRKHNDVPQFLKNIGGAVKEWLQLQKFAGSVSRNAQFLSRAAVTKDAVALKVAIEKLRIDLKNVEAIANKAIKG